MLYTVVVLYRFMCGAFHGLGYFLVAPAVTCAGTVRLGTLWAMGGNAIPLSACWCQRHRPLNAFGAQDIALSLLFWCQAMRCQPLPVQEWYSVGRCVVQGLFQFCTMIARCQ